MCAYLFHNPVAVQWYDRNADDAGLFDCVHNCLFDSVEDSMQKLEEYICYFNNGRVSLILDGMSPVEYRTHSS